MKIAQIVCRFKPYKGGISNVAYDHALGLAQLGHQVTVFTPLYSSKDKNYVSADFKIKRLSTFGKIGNGAFLPQLLWQLKKFDIVHLHYPFFGGAEVVWLLKMLRGKKLKLIITYHMDVIGGIFLKTIFKFHTKYIMPQIIKSADYVIVDSLDYAESSNISKLIKKNPEKYIELHPSVDLEKFFPNPKDKPLLFKYAIHPEFDRILLFVGALDKAHYFKGIEFLIETFKLLDTSNQDKPWRTRLLIVGEGSLKEKYRGKAAEAGMQEKIIFADPVADKDLPKYYNLAEIVILPSIDRSEAFGITLIEALACAKPVIAANLPGVREVVKNGENGFVFEVKNEGDLASRINILLNDSDLMNKMGETGRKNAEKYYDHGAITKKLEDVYKKIA